MADANEGRRRAAIEPGPALEHADDAAHSRFSWGLEAIGKVALDEPVAESGGLEPKDFVAITDWNQSLEAAVGRAIEPGGRGDPEQRWQRRIAVLVAVDLVAGRRLDHWVGSLLNPSEWREECGKWRLFRRLDAFLA